MNQIKTTTAPFNGFAKRPFKNADTHNFGRFVCQVDSEFIYKPRSIFWEWLFLDRSSSMRAILDLQKENLFGCLPHLIFKSENYSEGLVEICSVNTLVPVLSEQDLIQTGAVLGLMSFFGITDLHKDNIACGSFRGRYIFTPLDIEAVFDNIELPAQTLLLPSRLIDKDRCGLANILTQILPENLNLNSISLLSYGYVEALELLSQNSTEIFYKLTDLISKYNPVIRRVLKPTKDYYKALNEQSAVGVELDTSELIQLRRGDIPYFFKYTSSDEVYFYLDADLKATEAINHQQVSLSSTIQNLRLPEFNSTLSTRLNNLSTSGLLQILRLIPKDTKVQQFKYKTLSVRITDAEIIVETNSKAIKCKRLGL